MWGVEFSFLFDNNSWEGNPKSANNKVTSSALRKFPFVSQILLNLESHEIVISISFFYFMIDATYFTFYCQNSKSFGTRRCVPYSRAQYPRIQLFSSQYTRIHNTHIFGLPFLSPNRSPCSSSDLPTTDAT